MQGGYSHRGRLRQKVRRHKNREKGEERSWDMGWRKEGTSRQDGKS